MWLDTGNPGKKIVATTYGSEVMEWNVNNILSYLRATLAQVVCSLLLVGGISDLSAKFGALGFNDADNFSEGERKERINQSPEKNNNNRDL